MPTLISSAPWTPSERAQLARETEANEIIKAAIGLRTRIHLHLDRVNGRGQPAGGTSRFAEGDELDTLIASLDALVSRYEEE